MCAGHRAGCWGTRRTARTEEKRAEAREDRKHGRAAVRAGGEDELQCYAALGVGDTESCSVERLGVDNDAAFGRVPYGLFE